MSAHAFINVLLPFRADLADKVDGVIAGLAAKGNLPNDDVRGRLDETRLIHFMTFTVVRPVSPAEAEPGSQAPKGVDGRDAHLVVEIAADGGAQHALEVLADAIDSELRTLLGAAGIALPEGNLGEFLFRHHREIGTRWGAPALGQVFSGTPELSVRRILDEDGLAKEAARLVADFRQAPEYQSLSPRQRLDCIRDCLWYQGKWKWALVPEPARCLQPGPKVDWTTKLRAGLLGVDTLLWPIVLPAAILLVGVFWYAAHFHGLMMAVIWTPVAFGLEVGALAAAFGALFARLRRLEATDEVEDKNPVARDVQAIMACENFTAQNHLASVSRLKGGWVRKLTLRLAFFIVGLGPRFQRPGFLGRNGVIHFARWLRLPGTDQLLFRSNYDGTWDAYVGDFIADAPSGVTAIWSNCFGFPRTRALYGGGATDRDRLVRWARRQQQPTLFWYSAYETLTAARIRLNAAIRQGIASASSDSDAMDWFACFGSAPRQADALRVAEIPTLVFGGLSRMRYSAFHLVRFDADADACRSWVQWVNTVPAAYGETSPAQPRVAVVAFSASGLRKLGLPQDALDTFPVAFQHGMWPAWRARALGDSGRNDPADWWWGGNGNSMDALLLLYAADKKALRELEGEHRDTCGKLGQTIVHTLRLRVIAKHRPHASRPDLEREPFGFVDGVSQPILRGSPRAITAPDPINLVAPGEFVLGYPDNLNGIPPSPSIAASEDPDHMLPDAGVDKQRLRPEFSVPPSTGRRDLGANGTFLVARQLEQDYRTFDSWLDAQARLLTQNASLLGDLDHVIFAPLVRDGRSRSSQSLLDFYKEAIAAKMVGRWKDGTSLTRYPSAPGKRAVPPAIPDNEFRHGAEDGSGLACPFGAHIRRANPRDTRIPDDAQEIATVNRRRILRVGRAYRMGRANGGRTDPGLLFLCLNADIERQFEFVQKTWIMNPQVHGLAGEVDPILGHDDPQHPGERYMTIPTPTGPLRLEGLPEIVTVRGGGYFFVPSRTVLKFLARTGVGVRAMAEQDIAESA